MPGDQNDIYVLEIEGALNFLVVLAEAYKADIISKAELMHILYQFLHVHM